MGKLRAAGFSISLDGFGAGPGQSLADPQSQPPARCGVTTAKGTSCSRQPHPASRKGQCWQHSWEDGVVMDCRCVCGQCGCCP